MFGICHVLYFLQVVSQQASLPVYLPDESSSLVCTQGSAASAELAASFAAAGLDFSTVTVECAAAATGRKLLVSHVYTIATVGIVFLGRFYAVKNHNTPSGTSMISSGS